MEFISHHTTPLVINSLGGGHTPDMGRSTYESTSTLTFGEVQVQVHSIVLGKVLK